MFGRQKKHQASRISGESKSQWINMRLSGWLVVGLGFILVASQVAEELAKPDTMPLRAVQIDGEFIHVSSADIRVAMAEFADHGFVYVDTDQVKKKIESLPWVRTASVYRVWPDSLRVGVTEYQAVARWKDGGLITPSGMLFTPSLASYPVNLPLFHGPEGLQATMVQRYLEMRRVLATLLFSVTGLKMDQRRSWWVELDNGLVLVLGREENSQQRLLRFVQTYNSTLASRVRQIEQIDLRYTNGFAVRWKPMLEQHPGGVVKEMSNV